MLQALLEDRFKLVVHRDKKENPVLALVVAKGGPKMQESTDAPLAIDENAPLKTGEMSTEGPDGPVRMTMGKQGEVFVNMGVKGSMHYKVDPATMSMHLEGTQLQMAGFVDMRSEERRVG